MKNNSPQFIPEKEVIKAWQARLKCSSDIVGSLGETIMVVYPGRPNDHRGADFKDAIVAVGGDCRKGCIEVHSRVSGWEAHGHHQNPIYNQVILHVAMENDRPDGTVLQNGLTVPTVIIDKSFLSETRGNLTGRGLPCLEITHLHGIEEITFWLEMAGEMRFLSRVLRFQNNLCHLKSDQSLYEGIVEALGYTKNKGAFLTLSQKLPLQSLEFELQKAFSVQEGLIHIQGLLLGKAGLLDSSCVRQIFSGEYVSRLNAVWLDFTPDDKISSPDWELFKVRPGNHPVVRILALSYLLSRYRKKGILKALLDLIKIVPYSRSQPTLESFFQVRLTEQGKDYRFDRMFDSATNPVLLGKERAAEIVVNVVLPFFIAWSRMNNNPGLERKVNKIYHRYLKLESNSIEKHMLDQIGLDSQKIKLACQQQGLIHIYKTLCIQGKCKECFLVK